jgi:hypothetical protein
VQNFTERVVSALSSGKVEFIVVGGVSALLQGAPIVTCFTRRAARELDALVPPTVIA